MCYFQRFLGNQSDAEINDYEKAVEKLKAVVGQVHRAVSSEKVHAVQMTNDKSEAVQTMKTYRDKLINQLFGATRRVVKNSELDGAIIDSNTECLHFWMRGYSTTEPGEHKPEFVESEPTKEFSLKLLNYPE